jgi:hypothetical protein
MHKPRSENQTLRSVTDSCLIVQDLGVISYMIIQDHTKTHTENRRLRFLISIRTLSLVYGPTIRSYMII